MKFTLRELRMWHWREWMRMRAQQRAFPEGSTSYLSIETSIAPHVAAVQCLNDHCPEDTTAERDCALADSAAGRAEAILKRLYGE